MLLGSDEGMGYHFQRKLKKNSYTYKYIEFLYLLCIHLAYNTNTG